jgi:hypothetical protein
MIDQPSGLSEKADAAFLEAMTAVLKRARQSGTPVIIWKDNRVTAVSSEELETRLRECFAGSRNSDRTKTTASDRERRCEPVEDPTGLQS